MEVAHRLSLLPGKCQQIHGHSMMVTLDLRGFDINENGIAGGIDFGALKKLFRNFIDTNYDHHLHLNQLDEWAEDQISCTVLGGQTNLARRLPGLVTHPGDPTVENLAKWIAEAMAEELYVHFNIQNSCPVELCISIAETGTNGASWSITLAATNVES